MRGGARRAAGARRPVRDHRRRRRLDATAPAQIADGLAAANPDVVRVVHHPTNLGYGAALRSGFRRRASALVAFTDGDRQFQVADLGRLTARIAQARTPRTSWSASGSSGPTRSIRTLYARLVPAGQPDLLRPSRPRRRLRLQAVPARGAGRRPRRVRRGVLLGRAADQAPAAGRHVVEVGVPPLPADGRLADRARSRR